MRRLSSSAVDELHGLLRKLLEFRNGDGTHLPGYAEAILVYLRLQPEGAARMGPMREQLGLPQSRTSRLCAVLEERELVEISPSPEDRRSSAVRLTPKGQRLVDRLISA